MHDCPDLVGMGSAGLHQACKNLFRLNAFTPRPDLLTTISKSRQRGFGQRPLDLKFDVAAETGGFSSQLFLARYRHTPTVDDFVHLLEDAVACCQRACKPDEWPEYAKFSHEVEGEAVPYRYSDTVPLMVSSVLPVDLESSLENENKHVCGCAFMLLVTEASSAGPILVNVGSDDALHSPCYD